MFSRSFLASVALTSLAACTTSPANSAAPVTHFKGVAYTFNTPMPIAGATISVAELPQFTTTTDANGYYDLSVEVTADSQKVTPFIAKSGFHTIYLQTFTLHPNDADLDHVHFQTPDDDTFFLLASLVGVGPKTTQCQVVTTSSDKVIQGMTYEQFRDHGAHGVAGVVATATPTNSSTVRKPVSATRRGRCILLARRASRSTASVRPLTRGSCCNCARGSKTPWLM